MTGQGRGGGNGLYADVAPRTGSNNPRYCAYTVTLTINGPCGPQTLSVPDYVDTYGMYLGCQYSRTAAPVTYDYRMYPNPAGSELLIESVAATPATTMASKEQAVDIQPAVQNPVPFEVHLYDPYGKEASHGTSQGGKVFLNVQNLPNGLYIMRAGTGKEAVSKRIQIEH